MDCWSANEPGAKFGQKRSLIWEVPGRFLSSLFNLVPSGGFFSEFGFEKIIANTLICTCFWLNVTRYLFLAFAQRLIMYEKQRKPKNQLLAYIRTYVLQVSTCIQQKITRASDGGAGPCRHTARYYCVCQDTVHLYSSRRERAEHTLTPDIREASVANAATVTATHQPPQKTK